MHIDIVVPFPRSRSCSHILIVVDHYNCWVEAAPLTDTMAPPVANAFLHIWVSLFEWPISILAGTIDISTVRQPDCYRPWRLITRTFSRKTFFFFYGLTWRVLDELAASCIWHCERNPSCTGITLWDVPFLITFLCVRFLRIYSLPGILVWTSKASSKLLYSRTI